MPAELAVEARGLAKRLGGRTVLDAIDLAVPAGTIHGVLGTNGAGKTTTIRTLLGILAPDAGARRLLGEDDPLRAAPLIGYLPEERGLYPSMTARESIAFLGALRGLPLATARRRADALLADAGLGEAATRPIRALSKGMAQTVQLLGTIVHAPRLLVLDEPFSGLDAVNQGRLETLIRGQVAAGATVLFSTHVIAHAERLCEGLTIIAGGRVAFAGSVEAARGRLPAHVRLATRAGAAIAARLPADALFEGGAWRFAVPADGIESMLARLIADGAGIEALSIERPSLHEAFVDLVGGAPARVAA